MNRLARTDSTSNDQEQGSPPRCERTRRTTRIQDQENTQRTYTDCKTTYRQHERIEHDKRDRIGAKDSNIKDAMHRSTTRQNDHTTKGTAKPRQRPHRQTSTDYQRHTKHRTIQRQQNRPTSSDTPTQRNTNTRTTRRKISPPKRRHKQTNHKTTTTRRPVTDEENTRDQHERRTTKHTQARQDTTKTTNRPKKGIQGNNN